MVARMRPKVTFTHIACLDSLPFNTVDLRLTPLCTYFFCTQRQNTVLSQARKFLSKNVFQLLNFRYQDFTLVRLVAIQKQVDLEYAEEPEQETTQMTMTPSKLTERLGLND
jgi:hypothetical protein